MTVAVEARRRPGTTESSQRRWRLGVLLGLVALLALGGFATVMTVLNIQASHSTAVLKAASDIRAGSVISDDEISVAYVRTDDTGVLASLVAASQRSRLVGQVATESVPAGSLLPAGLGAPRASVSLWDVPLAIKRMPPDLRAGDHVAVIANATTKSGEPIEFVAAQDVRVLAVSSSEATLWLPASASAQMEWYADHGGLVLVRMEPGTTQQQLPVGGQTS
jgi:hypothetical protein